MKYLSILAITLMSAAAFMSSCGKDDDGTHCRFVSPSLILVDYTEAEMDTLILRRYEKTNSFTNLIDTAVFSKGEITYKEVGDDSFRITSNKEAFRKFSEELYQNDWEIYIPATGEKSRITEVKPRFLSGTDPGEECRSFAEFMRLDGNKREYTTWFGDGYRFFVTK